MYARHKRRLPSLATGLFTGTAVACVPVLLILANLLTEGSGQNDWGIAVYYAWVFIASGMATAALFWRIALRRNEGLLLARRRPAL